MQKKPFVIHKVIHKAKEGCCIICNQPSESEICNACNEISNLFFNNSIYEFLDYLTQGEENPIIEEEMKIIRAKHQK